MFRWNGRWYKYILILQLGFEIFCQGILYIIVATSQASTGKSIAVFVGIVQALGFCACQIHELKSLLSDGNAVGNPGAGSATPPPSATTVSRHDPMTHDATPLPPTHDATQRTFV